MSNSVSLTNNGLQWTNAGATGSSIIEDDSGNLIINPSNATTGAINFGGGGINVNGQLNTNSINTSNVFSGNSQLNIFSNTGVTFFGSSSIANTYSFQGSTGSYFSVNYIPGDGASGQPLYWSTTYKNFYIGISSIKYKENIASLPEDRYNIQNFMKLRPVIYNSKGDQNKKKIGFIAENAAELSLDELVLYNTDGGCEYFYYEQMTSFITKIVQEHQTHLETQKTQLETQQSQLEHQQSQINELIQQINELKALITQK